MFIVADALPWLSCTIRGFSSEVLLHCLVIALLFFSFVLAAFYGVLWTSQMTTMSFGCAMNMLHNLRDHLRRKLKF